MEDLESQRSQPQQGLRMGEQENSFQKEANGTAVLQSPRKDAFLELMHGPERF